MHLLLVATAIACLSSAAHAQSVDTIAEPRDSGKVALARELMRAARAREQFITTMREASQRQAADVPAGFWEKFIARAEQDADAILAPMADDYARYFSAADLRALIAFYKTPTGQRLSVVTPIIAANSSKVGQEWGMRVGTEIAQTMGDTPTPSKPTPQSKTASPPPRKP
jgi:hypothetical protein